MENAKGQYLKDRELMVRNQIAARGVRDSNVLNAMLNVPRHVFVGKENLSWAYADSALPIGNGQTISQPYMVAVMTELLELNKNDRVLEIGTGSGYQACVLAEIAFEVYTVERIVELQRRAVEKFDELGYRNIYSIVADGTIGWQEKAPFNKIIITAGCPDIPQGLIEQLADGVGIIVAPVGSKFTQQLLKLTKRKGGLTKGFSVSCVFVPLIGKYGWSDL